VFVTFVAIDQASSTEVFFSYPINNLTNLNRNIGLKAQLVSSVRWLADVTDAEVKGCFVGSKTLEFRPNSIRPIPREIKIKYDTAGSALLVFQAIFPLLLFVGAEKDDAPITLTIQGGTNVSFSLSFEYLDQVMLPALEQMGLPSIERKLIGGRWWSSGSQQLGVKPAIQFKFTPLARGQALKPTSWPVDISPGTISHIAITAIVPQTLRDSLKSTLAFELDLVFPGTPIKYEVDEDSKHPSSVYVLLVAHTTTGLRFGHDWLYDKTTKNKTMDKIATELSQRVVDGLDVQVRKGGSVDLHLQDQIVVFQALSEGRTLACQSKDDYDPATEREDRTGQPFGHGTLHTRTARWIVSELMPDVKWFNDGSICQGVGWKAGSSLT
jgi:RNA 3'-terminal phosphate cyclase (ATP)